MDLNNLISIPRSLQARKALKKAQDRCRKKNLYQAVIAAAAESIIFIDPKTYRCLEANTATQKLLGYRSSELQQLTLHDLIADTSAPIRQTLDNLLNSTQPSLVEWQFRCKEGLLIQVETSLNSVTTAHQSILCLVSRDITQRKQLEAALQEHQQRLSWQAHHDTLTGLANRYEFEQQLAQALDSAIQERHTHVLLYLDLDQFKIVNDTCGHIAGDDLLRQVGELLKTKLRKTDHIARLGGDEFAGLLHQCPLDQAIRIANQIRQTIQDFRFVWQDHTFAIGVSIGLVTLDANSQSLMSVLAAADAACYAAKHQGRNRVHVYQAPDLDFAQGYNLSQALPL